MARIEVIELPALPTLKLGLINADFPTGPLPAQVMHDVIATPAYWAFCWGSGLATAQWLYQRPELVEGKKVIDLGCGSGVVAIAAKQMGAEAVWACDIDPGALLATEANAKLNSVDLHLCDTLDKVPDHCDLLFMADVLYDRSNFALLNLAKQKAAKLLIADSRISDVQDAAFTAIHTKEALTCPNLGEFDEFKTVTFFEYDQPELSSTLA